MNSNDNAIVDYVDEKIDLVLEVPHAWGGAEPLEPLILMLLMIRQFVAFGDENERQLMRSYRQHLARSVGKGSARLIDRLPDGDKCDAAVSALTAFVEQQRSPRGSRIPEVPPEGHGSPRLVTVHEDVSISPFLRATGS